MAPDNGHPNDSGPPIPTYDEAIAGGTWQHSDRSPLDENAEGQSLLTSRTPRPYQHSDSALNGGSRRQRGYRAPTVETDDEDSLLGSDSDTDREADHVRREMQEMEIDDSDTRGMRNRSSWGKRIGLSLPQWRWRWRWRLPQLRSRQRPADPPSGAPAGEGEAVPETTPGARFAFPTLGSTALFLIVARALAIMLVLGFLYLVFVSDFLGDMSRRMGSGMFDPASVRRHVKHSVDPMRIRATLKHFAGYAHVAGTSGDYALAQDTEMLFRKYGLEDVTVDTYNVYLNYPKAGGRAVEILGSDGKPEWSAKLEEDERNEEKIGYQAMAFHGHSMSGDVKGPLVYANYGNKKDYEWLKANGVDTKGAIALVRYGGRPNNLGWKVKEAELAGFAGCLVYSDPRDTGRDFPADGVQRGSVSLTSHVIGDVLTPEWGSKDDKPRMRLDQTAGLVKIPSLPLAWRDAQILLQRLQTHGHRVPEPWTGGIPNFADIPEWWTGNATSPVVRLKNEQDFNDRQPIWNVYGRILGSEQTEKKIIIGNHRDSWGFGAVDGHSGTTIMFELVRIFGDLLAQGWRPRRTIEFMSWDGEEYNMIGSTEYVEQNDDLLRRDGVAYINLGAAVRGNQFNAAGSPMFYKLLLEVLHDVQDPNYDGNSLRVLWEERKSVLERLDDDSDYVPFQDIVGTSSLDLSFVGSEYPAHSSYETFDWVDRVGDPGFVYHALMSQFVGLFVLELCDRPVLPFDIAHYTNSLGSWIEELEGWAKSLGDSRPDVSLAPLVDAHHEVVNAVREFVKWERSWEATVLASSGIEPPNLSGSRVAYNTKMAQFESDLLDNLGIPNRTQFKHVIFGPRLSGEDIVLFPSIRDTIASGNQELATQTVVRVADIIKKAAARLLE
ncbi:hypothetical protein QBC39DRAFT_387846 [Podospora conica]|nr:hypothetical protein QBC39DRAFT_387846 [Schizothecium conicum]